MEPDNFSQYIAYPDESGDHSLTHIDEQYPVFVLSLCIFRKDNYARRVVPRFQELKFKYFGHDNIIFHEREIRKQINEFSILRNSELRGNFFVDLSAAIAKSRFRISASVIDKRALRGDLFPDNPYVLALRLCMEKINELTRNDKASDQGKLMVVFEKRGAKEDRDLELKFLRIISGNSNLNALPGRFQLVFADKKSNTTGMQLADMTARPIGVSIIRPRQSNRAFSLIRPKLIRSKIDRKGHRGIIVYP